MIHAVRSRLDEGTWQLLSNTVSMIGTIGVTSGLGFVYWWAAAQFFSDAQVGFAGAAISAMILMASMGMMGMGTVFMSEQARRPQEVGVLLFTALVVAGTISGVLGIGFALLAPSLSSDLSELSANLWHVALFAGGVSAASLGMVLDQSLIGLLAGKLQLWRNIVLGVVKLAVVVGFGFLLQQGVESIPMPIYLSWAASIVFSLVVVWYNIRQRNLVAPPFRFKPALLSGLGRSVLTHHVINLMIEAPSRTLPLLVTVVISVNANASFYVSWMIVALVFAAADALTFVLYAVGAQASTDSALLAQKMRLTLKLSVLFGTLGAGALFLLAEPLLGLFGANYATEAAWCLRILGLGVFGIIIKDHYVAVQRIQRRTDAAAIALAVGFVLELTLAGIGAVNGGLTGLAIGWLAALCVEAVFFSPVVYRAARG